MVSARQGLTIPLQGGLGNQLFQLAAGLVVGQRHGLTVRYSDYWLHHPLEGETPRTFELDGLIPEEAVVSVHAPRVGHAADRLRRRRVIERSPDDDALARVGRGTRVLAGYFQHLSYATEAWPSLRALFAASPRSVHRALVCPAPEAYGALHYRLGDYVSNPSANAAHGVTSPEFFASVVREGYETLGLTDWRVVSDDPVAATDLLRSVDLPEGTRLRTPDGAGEWSDLAVLANARMCAISNSSFSWWAAFIGSTAAVTTVVAPRPWFAGSTAVEPPLFPASWLRRERTLLSAVAPSAD